MLNRRSFIRGLGLLLAAPAIVHAGNLMPVKAIPISIDELLRQRMNEAYKLTAQAMNENLYLFSPSPFYAMTSTGLVEF